MPTIQVLIDAKVAGLGEVGALDGEVQRLGASTTTLGTNLDKTTGQLNVAGSAHGAAAKEAQALGAGLEKTTGSVNLAGEAHLKAATATSSLGSKMEQAAVQAKSYGTEADSLSQKLSALQGPSGLAGVEAAAAGTTTALQGLASADAQTAASSSAVSDAAQFSTSAITDLAAVDATMASGKKTTAAEVAKEAVALEAAERTHEAHTEAVLKGVKATGEFGAAGVEAKEKLGALSGILGGAGGISLGLAGFVVGAGAAIAVAKSGVESFLSFGEAVLKFQRITGMTAESSSRLLDVFQQFGVDGDVADKAMFQLAHRTEELGGHITKTEKTLQDLGVEVAKNKDGSTDLEKTLVNVAGAYGSASSAADKNAIAYAAFGKSAQSLIPVLEQGSTGLQQLSNNASRIFTQQQLEQVHQYNVEMARAGQEIDRTKDGIGGFLVPAIGAMAQSFNDSADASRYLDDKLKEQNRTMPVGRGEAYALAYQGRLLADQQKKNAEASKEEAEAAKRLTDQLAAEEQVRQDLLDQDNQSIQAEFGLQRSAQAVTSAQRALADETLKDTEYTHKHQASVDQIAAAQAKYNDAVKAHGPVSGQAKTAQDGLNKAVDAGAQLDLQNAEAADRLSGAQLQLKEAMLQDSVAARDLAAKQSELAGGHISAQDAAAAQAAELEKLKIAAGGVLPAELQTLLDKLNSFHDVSATVHLRLDDQTGGMRGSGGTQIPTFADGGLVPGPIGAPRFAVVHGGEEVLTPAQRQERARAGPTYTITQYITGVTDPVAAGDTAAARFSALLTST